MNKAYLQTMLQRPIAFHRVFVPLAGITGALFLSQLMYWSDKGSDKDGWIYKTQAEWTEETGLSRYEQEFVRKTLRKDGVLEERYSGLPAKLYYRINFDALGAFVAGQCEAASAKKSKSPQTACKVAADQRADAGFPASQPAAEPHSIYTENTAEISTESGKRGVVCGKRSAPETIQAAAASSIDIQIQEAERSGAVIENSEDRLVFAELISEVSLPQVLDAIKAIRTVDKRRAYASAVRKKLLAAKGIKQKAAVQKRVEEFKVDAEAESIGRQKLALIAQQAAARKAAKQSTQH